MSKVMDSLFVSKVIDSVRVVEGSYVQGHGSLCMVRGLYVQGHDSLCAWLGVRMYMVMVHGQGLVCPRS